MLQATLGCLGIRSRRLVLMSEDVEVRESSGGHFVTEAYLPDQDVLGGC